MRSVIIVIGILAQQAAAVQEHVNVNVNGVIEEKRIHKGCFLTSV